MVITIPVVPILLAATALSKKNNFPLKKFKLCRISN